MSGKHEKKLHVAPVAGSIEKIIEKPFLNIFF